MLRRGGEVQLSKELQAGAQGRIETGKGTKIAVRKGVSKRGSSLGTIDLDETSGKPMAQQLREVLTKNAVRVVDLFREWDEGAPPHDAASNPGPTACQRAALPAPHALRRTAAQTVTAL